MVSLKASPFKNFGKSFLSKPVIMSLPAGRDRRICQVGRYLTLFRITGGKILCKFAAKAVGKND